jgi:hypothetical protein
VADPGRRTVAGLASGVYLGLTGAPNLPQKEMAALLYAGPGNLITGPTALLHHGLRSPVSLEIVDVLVQGGRQRASTGFARLHRTYRMPPQVMTMGPLRLVGPARAVADTTRLLTELRDVRAVVADAVQRNRCTVRDLAGELRDTTLQHLASPDADVACLRPQPRMPVPAGHAGCSLGHLKDVRVSVAHPGARGPAGGRCSRRLPQPGYVLPGEVSARSGS